VAEANHDAQLGCQPVGADLTGACLRGIAQMAGGVQMSGAIWRRAPTWKEAKWQQMTRWFADLKNAKS